MAVVPFTLHNISGFATFGHLQLREFVGSKSIQSFEITLGIFEKSIIPHPLLRVKAVLFQDTLDGFLKYRTGETGMCNTELEAENINTSIVLENLFSECSVDFDT